MKDYWLLQQFQLFLAYLFPIIFICFFVLLCGLVTWRMIRDIAALESAVHLISEELDQFQELATQTHKDDSANWRWLGGLTNDVVIALEELIRNIELIQSVSYEYKEDYIQLVHKAYAAAYQLRELLYDERFY